MRLWRDVNGEDTRAIGDGVAWPQAFRWQSFTARRARDAIDGPSRPLADGWHAALWCGRVRRELSGATAARCSFDTTPGRLQAHLERTASAVAALMGLSGHEMGRWWIC